MTRALLATEGLSDEVVGHCLLTHVCPGIQVVCKAYPERGFAIVRRSSPTLARSAHFGFYDLLVVQFDLDDSIQIAAATTADDIRYSQRWNDIAGRIHKELNTLDHAGRTRAVRVVLMSPCQSTEAWLVWGMYNGSGTLWEGKDRQELKIKLYGDPPRGTQEKAALYAKQLVSRMKSSDSWPITLRHFVSQLETAMGH
jgi:hypothetical protein